jgi:hypothetical protein
MNKYEFHYYNNKRGEFKIFKKIIYNNKFYAVRKVDNFYLFYDVDDYLKLKLTNMPNNYTVINTIKKLKNLLLINSNILYYDGIKCIGNVIKSLKSNYFEDYLEYLIKIIGNKVITLNNIINIYCDENKKEFLYNSLNKKVIYNFESILKNNYKFLYLLYVFKTKKKICKTLIPIELIEYQFTKLSKHCENLVVDYYCKYDGHDAYNNIPAICKIYLLYDDIILIKFSNVYKESYNIAKVRDLEGYIYEKFIEALRSKTILVDKEYIILYNKWKKAVKEREEAIKKVKKIFDIARKYEIEYYNILWNKFKNM